jgi:hypothetical protein
MAHGLGFTLVSFLPPAKKGYRFNPLRVPYRGFFRQYGAVPDGIRIAEQEGSSRCPAASLYKKACFGILPQSRISQRSRGRKAKIFSMRNTGWNELPRPEAPPRAGERVLGYYTRAC